MGLGGGGNRWVSGWEFPIGPSGAGASGPPACRLSGPQDMLHWAPFSFRAGARRISVEEEVEEKGGAGVSSLLPLIDSH